MIMKIAKKITLWYIAKQKKYASGYKSGIKYIDSINAAYQFFDTSYFQNNGKGLCLPDYELITSYDMKYAEYLRSIIKVDLSAPIRHRTNEGLFNICKEALFGLGSKNTNEDIFRMCIKGLAYIQPLENEKKSEYDTADLSSMQVKCANDVRNKIDEGNFMEAAKDFLDCVSNLGKAEREDRNISYEEFCLYESLLMLLCIKMERIS